MRDTEGYYIMIKWSIHQENTVILNVYILKKSFKTYETRNNKAKRRDKATNTAEDSNTPVLANDRSTREKKISKDIKEPSNTIKRYNWHL